MYIHFNGQNRGSAYPRDYKTGTPLEELPEANLFNLLQKSDFIPAGQQGMALGGTTGPLATTLAGAGVGAWLSGMVGMSIGNRRTKKFEEAIEADLLLLLAEVPADRALVIERRVK